MWIMLSYYLRSKQKPLRTTHKIMDRELGKVEKVHDFEVVFDEKITL